MPIYEYLCGGCGREFEELAPASESDAPRECPHCGAEGKRQLSACSAKTAGDAFDSMHMPGSGASCSGGGGFT